jgi:pyruvate/2-oxoglutarate dehydrogenase complex dihydrolipoamide acyltransferase (E2) component
VTLPNDSYAVETIAPGRPTIIDGLAVGARRHMAHALVEIDVTVPRRVLREHKQATGEAISFTAFVIAAAARAVAAHRHLNSYRDWRNRLIVFDDVDVATLVEAEAGAVAIPHVVRAANRKSVREIHDEIRAVQARPASSPQRSGRLASLAARRVPGLMRRLFLRVLRRAPRSLKRLAGTTVVSAVGMFAGRGGGWAVAIVPLHTLALTLGGIVERPALVAGAVVAHEYLDVTVSVDHDVVDGAPAARFVHALRSSIESGAGLDGM